MRTTTILKGLVALLLVTSACADTAGDEHDAGDLSGTDAGSDAAADTAFDDGRPDSSTPDGSGTDVDPGYVYGTYDPHPEPPLILRDVALIDDDAEFTRPFVPGHRTTMDGRVAIRVQGGPPGTREVAENLSFWLFAPERLEEPIMTGPPGAQILADPEPFDVLFPPAVDPSAAMTGHHAICDPTEPYPRPGERPNPQPCDENPDHDCYRFTVISTTSRNVMAQIWGTPVTVEVASPKTAEARIVDVELGESVAGMVIEMTTELMEPTVARDGRLLTGRVGRAPRPWTNPNTGETMTRPYDLVYFLLPDDAEPCDVTGWTEFHPMSHAPFDPRMIGTYGLAAYPFRDTEGEVIADGEDLSGTYPWVDREGANVFMAAVPGRIAEQSETRYPRRCVVPGCEDYSENIDWDRGFMVAGLWTHGKFVHLDGMINNQDWAIGVTPSAHFMVDLYRDSAGNDVAVRLGAGRFIDSVRYAGGPYPAGYTHNANILDSIQNLLNHTPASTPVLPRDVVWVMSTGVATDEIAFDDFLETEAFIVSNMQASVTPLYNEDGETTSFPHHWNGQVRRLELPLPLPAFYVLKPELDDEIHLQNAATSLNWNVPSYGYVAPGTARVEPTALGGIHGRGFWLSGENEIRYTVPTQPRSIRETDWYFSVFLDPRAAASEVRAVATFPDGSALHTAGHERVRYVRGGAVVHEVALPASEGWFHLGVVLEDENRHVTLLHNGMALDRFESDVPLFELTEGDLVIGGGDTMPAGFRGWIDDLKVFAYAPSAEVLCNHAHGTMVQVFENDDWAAVASLYPEWSHAAAAAQAGVTDEALFACFHDYSRDFGAHLGNIPVGTNSVRERIIFPEGPIRAGAPRPDSLGNAFCRSCHTVDGKGAMSLDALRFDPDTIADHDTRRQPMQPPRRVFGNIPAGWLSTGAGPGNPTEALRAPPEGLLIDRWLLEVAD